MFVEEQNVVTLSYELRENHLDGELLERMDHNYPFIFLFGSGKLLPSFEAKLLGLEEGAQFEFTLKPEEAYGPIRADHVVSVPRTVFEQSGELPVQIQEGVMVSLSDDLGNRHNGSIVSFNEEEVRVDLNHSMAGKHLHFKGVVLNIRPATIDELIRKHYIQAGGVHRPDFGQEEIW